jgi:uncharacterized protein (TIGR03083 family)
VEVAAHIDALRAQGELMAAAVDASDPGAPVPTCPGWAVRDLVRHMGGVHRWATGYVAGARTEMRGAGLDEIVGAGPDDVELADWLRQGCTALTAALTAAPSDLECWTFLPAPSPLAMWARRQAHETAIHRVDAERAGARAVKPFAPPFAADGVDELLACFVPRRSSTLRAEVPTRLAVRCGDADAAWTLHLDGDGVTTTAGADDHDVACTVAGTAGDLYLGLWNRAGPDRLAIEGDASVLRLFLDRVNVRWS